MSLHDQIRKEEEELKAQMEVQEEEAKAAEKGQEEGTEDEGQDGEEEAEQEQNTKANEIEKGQEEGTEDEGQDGEEEAAKAETKKGEGSVEAQLRIERKQRKELEARLAALESNKASQPPAQRQQTLNDETQTANQGPTVEERVAAIEQQRQEQDLRNQAISEFQMFENEFQKNTPDYAQASDHMINTMANGVRAAYPNATDQQVGQFIQNQILTIASQAANKGLNPAETLYLMAMQNYGYDPQAAAVKNAENVQTKSKNAAKRLETVSKNKRRSASPLASGGHNGSPSATIEEAASMDLADFSKLSDAEISQMIADAQ